MRYPNTFWKYIRNSHHVIWRYITLMENVNLVYSPLEKRTRDSELYEYVLANPKRVIVFVVDDCYQECFDWIDEEFSGSDDDEIQDESAKEWTYKDIFENPDVEYRFISDYELAAPDPKILAKIPDIRLIAMWASETCGQMQYPEEGLETYYPYMSQHDPKITGDVILANPDKNWDYGWLSCSPYVTFDTILSSLDKPWDDGTLTVNPNLTFDIIRDNPTMNWYCNDMHESYMDRQPMTLQLAARDAIHKYDLNTTSLPKALHDWCNTTVFGDGPSLSEGARLWKIECDRQRKTELIRWYHEHLPEAEFVSKA